MSDTNQLTISGNLTRDAELRSTNSGGSVLSFSVANNTGYGQYEQTNFFDCCMFGERAEKLAEHLTKGKPIICSGEHVQSVWNDRETGKERRRFELKVFSLTFQRGDKSERREEAGNTNYGRARAQADRPAETQPAPPVSEDDSDIPF